MNKPIGFSIEVSKKVPKMLTAVDCTATFKAYMLIDCIDGIRIALPWHHILSGFCSNEYLEDYLDELIIDFKKLCTPLNIDIDIYDSMTKKINWRDALTKLSLGESWASALVL